jgi:hypothetical protein
MKGAAYYSPSNLLLPVKKLAGGVARMPTLHELVFDRMAPAMAWESSVASENNPCSEDDSHASNKVHNNTARTTHDWPVISHYYVHLCAKVLAE